MTVMRRTVINLQLLWAKQLNDLSALRDLISRMTGYRLSADSGSLMSSSVGSTVVWLLLVNLVLVLITRRGRKLVFDVVETLLACILVVFLLTIVLGLPVGEHFYQSAALA